MRAIVHAEGDRRVRHRHRVDRRFFVEIFVAVPLATGNPPGRAVLREIEFGQLIRDPQCLTHAPVVEDIAKGDCIVEHAEGHAETPLFVAVLLETDGQFVVVIAHEALLAPRLFPCFVMACPRRAGNGEAPFELVLIGQQETEPAFREDGVASLVDAVERPALAVDIDRDGDGAIGRSRHFFGQRRCAKHRGKEGEEGQ